MTTETVVTITGQDLANGDSFVNLSSANDGAQIYPYLNFIFAQYGLDAADAKVIIQGSLDQQIWFDCDDITLATSTKVDTITAIAATAFAVAGDVTQDLINGKFLYASGNTTPANNGRFTIVGSNYKGRLTYSNISSGTFTVGHTITGSVSGATAKIAKQTSTLLFLTSLTGQFSGSDVITESVSGKTADVDTADAFTTIEVAETLTVEAPAGDLWLAESSQLAIIPQNTLFLYYRLAIQVNSVTKGFLDCVGIGKSY